MHFGIISGTHYKNGFVKSDIGTFWYVSVPKLRGFKPQFRKRALRFALRTNGLNGNKDDDEYDLVPKLRRR
jgi:hypothetical protein